MDRRDLLKMGAAAGLSSMGSTSCLMLPRIMLDNDPLPLPDMDDYLRQVDQGVEYIENISLFTEESGLRGQYPEEERLGAKAFKSLYLTSMFSDLPEEGQVHPGMQDRMYAAMPDMDEAIFGTSDYLKSRTPSDLETLQRTLHHKSDPGQEIAAVIDQHAAVCNVPARRREQTRGMLSYAAGRLRSQPPSLMINEYTSKVDKFRDSSGTIEEVQRRFASQMGEQAFWERQKRLDGYTRKWAEAGYRRDSSEPTATGNEHWERRNGRRPGKRIIRGGLITMGVGVVILGVGGIMLGASGGEGWLAGAILMTIGGVVLLVGLIITIAGGIRKARLGY